MTQKMGEAPELVEPEYRYTVRPAALTDTPRDLVTLSTKAPPRDDQSTGATLTLDIWIRTSGRRPDQTAGFRFWARARKLAPRTAQEWEDAFDAFLRRPV